MMLCNSAIGPLLWACTDRAKSVAANVKKNKSYFRAQLTGEQFTAYPPTRMDEQMFVLVQSEDWYVIRM